MLETGKMQTCVILKCHVNIAQWRGRVICVKKKSHGLENATLYAWDACPSPVLTLPKIRQVALAINWNSLEVPCAKTQQQDYGEWTSIQISKAILDGWGGARAKSQFLNDSTSFSRKSIPWTTTHKLNEPVETRRRSTRELWYNFTLRMNQGIN